MDEFSTVDDFLRQAAEAKSGKRFAIASNVEAQLSEHGAVAVYPKLGELIEALVVKYGDEVYRQLALYCLGKWFEHHVLRVDDSFVQEDLAGGCTNLMDATRISDAMHLLAEVHSFSGDDEWKTMVGEKISQAILEELEEITKD